MKHNWKGLLLVLLVVGAISCKDDEIDVVTPEEQLEIDQQIITDYLAENNITAEEDSVYGIRFVIHEQGMGDKPTPANEINVDYEGRFLKRSEVFDSGDSVAFPLENLIPAWQIVLPYLREGGNLTMYVPSGYGYGGRQIGPIPPNSRLEFDVTLNAIVE